VTISSPSLQEIAITRKLFLVFLSLQHVLHLPELSGYHAITFSLALSKATWLSGAIWCFSSHMVVIPCSISCRCGSYQLSKCQTYPACFDLWFLWDFMLRCKFVQSCGKTWHTFQYSCVRPVVRHSLVESLKSSPCMTTRLPFPNLISAHIEHK
jgi:hypothetical protein